MVLAEATQFNFFFPVCLLFQWGKTCPLLFLTNGLRYSPTLSVAKIKVLCGEIKFWVASTLLVICWTHPYCMQTSWLLPLWLYLFFFFSGLLCLPSLPCSFAQHFFLWGRVYNPILFSHHSFIVLDLCSISSLSLLTCPLSPFPGVEPLLISCSVFTVISSLLPNQKTCKNLLSLPFFPSLPLFFWDVAQKWQCHRPEKGKIAFSVSDPQQDECGSVAVNQHGG